MTEQDFLSPDLGVSSRCKAQGLEPEVVYQEGSPRAYFKFRRTEQFKQVLAGLASGTIPENPEAVARARADLRARAIIAVESARSRP